MPPTLDYRTPRKKRKGKIDWMMVGFILVGAVMLMFVVLFWMHGRVTPPPPAVAVAAPAAPVPVAPPVRVEAAMPKIGAETQPEEQVVFIWIINPDGTEKPIYVTRQWRDEWMKMARQLNDESHSAKDSR